MIVEASLNFDRTRNGGGGGWGWFVAEEQIEGDGGKKNVCTTNFAGVAFTPDKPDATSQREQYNLSSDTHTRLLVRQIRGERKKGRIAGKKTRWSSEAPVKTAAAVSPRIEQHDSSRQK